MQKSFTFIRSQLRGLYPDTEIGSLSHLILEFVCQKDRHSLWLDKDKQLSANDRRRIEEIVAELKNFRPLQYITGETEFYGMIFNVDESVLIPRPETEELVEWIVNEESPAAILDLGAGSGCIAVSLAKQLPFASVYALDVSGKALEIAKRNAARNNVNVQFVLHDLFEDLPDNLPEQWDVIVSNPPYVTPAEKAKMSKNVLDYEPQQALFVPQDKPLLFYERIAAIASTCLKKEGSLYLETSSIYGKETAAMLKDKGFQTVELRKDISGRDRMIRAQLKNT
ncbi:MAG: peptide chain release factor N(5)-glutamine methyltransferase [Dysgonamonadaceae bacterium]|jgi:release factor glutamine methyltransferase|nr:peptide chain release factor N(5)-glutamine methyltransferase [Dysgonamonadaceae bacterium]